MEAIEQKIPVREFDSVSWERMTRAVEKVRERLHRTSIRDYISVGLVDRSWASRLPEKLAARLQQMLDTPDS